MSKPFYCCIFFFNLLFSSYAQDTGQGNVFYEIFLRSFVDANGDGLGDLRGATTKLDYLQQLGITGISLMPACPSPSHRKYDPVDYYGVDKDYGTMADFRNFISEAHSRGMKVIINLPVNQCSDQHPWFLEAKKSKASKYRSYFLWSDSTHLPYDAANWYASLDAKGKVIDDQKYYAFFDSAMPDLNFDNQEVRKEMMKIAAYWIKDTGADGFRVDAADHIYERQEKNYEWWNQFSDYLKSIKKDVILVGGLSGEKDKEKEYFQNGLTSYVDFSLSHFIIKALMRESSTGFSDSVLTLLKLFESNSSISNAMFLSDYRQGRMMSELEGSLNKAKMAMAITFTLPGTPYIFYGEEIGMLGRGTYPGAYEPFLWSEKGSDKERVTWIHPVFSNDETIVPLSIQQIDKSSVYNHCLNFIQMRSNYPVLQNGKLLAVHLDDDRLLAYQLTDGKQAFTVIHNVSSQNAVIPEKEFTITNNFIYGKRSISNLNGVWEVQPFSTVIFKFQ